MGDISKQKKAEGAMIAFAIGDALGWPYELNSGNITVNKEKDNTFMAWRRKNKTPFWHSETIKAGDYSDDTQLMLAVGRSLLTKDWQSYFTTVEYPFWLRYARGAGRAVLKAATSWQKGVEPWNNKDSCLAYFEAGGNGGAMRILPHVINNVDKGIDKIIDDVVGDAILSHGHPRAILGATCYAYALHYLFNKEGVLSFAELADALVDGSKKWGAPPNYSKFSEWIEIAKKQANYNYEEEWRNAYVNIKNGFKYVKQSLGAGILTSDTDVLNRIGAFSKENGAGDIAILSAVFLFSKYVNSPELAISIPAFSVGMDTDTIAAMTGGLVGAFHGTDWIPLEWRGVQDYKYISSLADDLYANKSIRTEEISGIDLRQMKIENVERLQGKYSTINITTYKTASEQTIYIKSVEKREKESTQIQSNDTSQVVELDKEKICLLFNDDLIARITLRKASEIVIKRFEGLDIERISKQTRINIDIVRHICEILKI